MGGGCSGVRGIEPILRVPLLLLLPLPLPCSLLSSNYYMLLQRIHNQLERRSCAFHMCKGTCAAFQENIDCRTMSRRTGTSAHGRCGETSATALLLHLHLHRVWVCAGPMVCGCLRMGPVGWGGARGVGLGWGVHPVRRTGTRYNAAMSSGVLQYGAQNRVAVRASRDPFRILKRPNGM